MGRRCQVHDEAARAHVRHGHDREAVEHLTSVQRMEPQVLRY
jgi:hypothetical protein